MIVQAAFSWGILLGLGTMGYGQTAPASAHLFGKWIVDGMLCANCGSRSAAEKGSVIEFTRNKIRDQLAHDCDSNPGYDLLKDMPAKQTVEVYGNNWPAAVNRAVLRHSKVRYGFVTCKGINFIQILFLSDKEAFYFFEGGIVLDLRRSTSASNAGNAVQQ